MKIHNISNIYNMCNTNNNNINNNNNKHKLVNNLLECMWSEWGHKLL
jgi:hypothetical protein